LGIMTGDTTGRRGPPLGVLVTREVRWFRTGAVPAALLDWYLGLADGEPEHRVDTYDTGSAARGIGVKRRNGDAVDAKVPLRHTGPVQLAPGIVGRVEDWVKLTFPWAGSMDGHAGLDVVKEIFTRRYPLEDHDDAGCEVELALIAAGPRRAWTLALETFGAAHLLDASFSAGVDALVAELPPPSRLRLAGAGSYGYPAWISQRVEVG
jgi:hypothetical protein